MRLNKTQGEVDPSRCICDYPNHAVYYGVYRRALQLSVSEASPVWGCRTYVSVATQSLVGGSV